MRVTCKAVCDVQAWPLLANIQARSHEAERYPLLLQSMGCEYEAKIVKDLARTFPMHPLFKDKSGVGQQKMFNVLKAYAVLDPELGYCQVSSGLDIYTIVPV